MRSKAVPSTVLDALEQAPHDRRPVQGGVVHHGDRGGQYGGPWRGPEAVGYAILEWVDWLIHRRPLEPIGNMLPAEVEARYHAQLEAPARAA
jgi:putative transposase